MDVNAMLGVGGDVGYGGCEPRIEIKNVGGGGAIFEPKTLSTYLKKREKK